MNKKTKIGTFVEVLEKKAFISPKKVAFTYLNKGGIKETITYEELINEVKQMAGFMQQNNYTGKRALIMYPSSIMYIKVFLACMFANVVAIPVYPPTLSKNMDRIKNIMTDSKASLIFTSKSLNTRLNNRLTDGNNKKQNDFQWICLEDITLPSVSAWSFPNIHNETVAFLQYTSGSTSEPKGVMVTHNNIVCNEEMIKNSFETTKNSVILGWLPMYHDMGLIGNVLHPLYLGATGILMDPMDFLQKPFRWLKAISDYQVDVSGGPNFAYELCLKKITDEELHSLNLTSWEVAFNGAEPISSDTIENFQRRFAICGFKENRFYPCYGLAEATLFVSGGKRHEKPIIKNFDSEELKQNRAIEVNDNKINSTSIVSCGIASVNQTVIVVDPKTKKIRPDGIVGEIWVKGDNVASGYLNDHTPEVFTGSVDGVDGFFLKTGDLGFIQQANLYVTGRNKDLIVIRGKNYYPQDIERLIEKYSCIRDGCSAAFSVTHQHEEKLVIVAELERIYRPRVGKQHESFQPKDFFSSFRKRIMEELGVQPFAIKLIKTGSILKTSSGKIRRGDCKQAYETGQLITWYEQNR